MSSHPERLGKYPIVRVLGEGAMGVVYEAFDPVIRRPLAIKAIRRELIEGGDGGLSAVGRFRNEARAAGRLAHPGIAAVYEYGEDERCAFIAMEFVPGNTLREYLVRRRRFAEEDLLSIMAQLLDALEYAHSQGVWHRDIKPANLMITRDGRLKVTDFGVARIDAVGLTLDGSVIGTPGYMAPEQYAGDAIDRRVDVYAAGVLMYELLAGRLPFTGTPEAVMYKTMTEMPEPPSRLEGAAQFERFDPIVLRALAKEVDARFASADEFRRALVEVSHRAVSDTLSEETLIMEPLRPDGQAAGSGALRTAAPGPTATDASAAVRATMLQHWDPAVLAEVEARLSRHLGPVARVMVRRAAVRCGDIATLTAMLADEIPEERERTLFRTATLAGTRGATGGGAGRGTVGGAGPASGAGGTRMARSTETLASQRTRVGGAAGDLPLTPDFLENATRLLAAQIGPIAKVLVRRAAERSADRRTFAQCVVGLSTDLKDTERLVSEILRAPG